MIEQQFRSGQVARYHCNPEMSRFRQTNADHQWGVAIVIWELHPNPSRNLLYAAMTHDGGEMRAGDISYPVKQANPEHAANHAALEMRERRKLGFHDIKLTEEEGKYLHLADRLESFLYMRLHGEERQWSSKHVRGLMELAHDLGLGSKVLDIISNKETTHA